MVFIFSLDLFGLMVLCLFNTIILFSNFQKRTFIELFHVLQDHIESIKISFLLSLEIIHLLVFPFESLPYDRFVADVGRLG